MATHLTDKAFRKQLAIVIALETMYQGKGREALALLGEYSTPYAARYYWIRSVPMLIKRIVA